jgi:hypothetical protein
MTREQAQEILLLQRPGAAADGDSDTAEALRLAEVDSELKGWLQQHLEFQTRVATEMGKIEPPADLKAGIIAGAKAAGSETQSGVGGKFSRRQILAIAASIILALALAGLWLSRRDEDAPTFANFRSRMTSFALRTYQMDIVTNNATAVRDYLKANGAPADFGLTRELAKLPVKGGGRLSWQNQPVAMMCFNLADNQTAFMFVMDESALATKPAQLEIDARKKFSSVTWTKDGKVYLLAAARRPDVLAALAEP